MSGRRDVLLAHHCICCQRIRASWMRVVFACVVLQSCCRCHNVQEVSGKPYSNVLLCTALAACVFVCAQSPQLTPADTTEALFFTDTPAYCDLQLDAAYIRVILQHRDSSANIFGTKQCTEKWKNYFNSEVFSSELK